MGFSLSVHVSLCILDKCHFLVDLDLSETTPLQPRYSQDTARWDILVKRPFLDANRFDVSLCVEHILHLTFTVNSFAFGMTCFVTLCLHKFCYYNGWIN